jgi:tRNA (mo5U34)-methyltransferase
MTPLTDQQLADFQAALPWKTGAELPDGRLLGVPGKRGGMVHGLDPRVAAVRDRLSSADKTVLEIGCCEGIYTVQLAGVCREVVGLDVRPHNIACALTRLFVHGVTNARLLLQDARELDGRIGRFDILFHVGVLYHLSDPVDHLRRVAGLADSLLLDTHYADDDVPFPRADIDADGRTYCAKVYQEGAWADVFSGVEPTSRWVYRDDLLQLLGDLGFTSAEVLDDRRERNGPRFTVLARRLSSQSPASGERERPEIEAFLRQSETDAAWREVARSREQVTALQSEVAGLRQSKVVRLADLVRRPLRLFRRAG